MAKRPVAIRIEARQYELIAKAMAADDPLPATYSDFLYHRIEEDKKALARGYTLREVTVDHKGFIKYCERSGQPPSYTMLRAYAVAKALRKPG